MPIPTWVPGQVLAAADVNSWFVPLVAYKASDTARSSNITLTADPDLQFTVPAITAVYRFEATIIFTALNGADIKWDWPIPAGATILYNCLHNEGGGTGLGNSALINTSGAVGFAAGSGTSTNVGLIMSGYLLTTGTGGGVNFRWAQNTTSGTATTARTGSLAMLERVS